MALDTDFFFFYVFTGPNSLGDELGTGTETIANISSPEESVNEGDPVTLTLFLPGGPSTFPATYTSLSTEPGSEGVVITLDSSIRLFTSDVSGLSGTDLTFEDPTPAICFGAGTMISTPHGEVAVETLKAGDIVSTADGGATTVRWLGRQTLNTVFTAADKVCPVLFRAGSLAENVPASDLSVTHDHGIVFDEAIVHAAALINGTTIQRVGKADLPERVTYYHIETEGHAVVMANGCPAETFIDNVARRAFDNFDEFVALYGEDQPETVPLGLPRAKGPRQVPVAIRSRISERALALEGRYAEAV